MKNLIIIYRFTGRQGPFTIPKKWCEECDLLIDLVKSIVKELNLESATTIIIRPWFIWFIVPLLQYRTFRAPILIINKSLVSAGVVPSKATIESAINR